MTDDTPPWGIPRPESALTFDEVEAAGLDGTLRTIERTPMTLHRDMIADIEARAAEYPTFGAGTEQTDVRTLLDMLARATADWRNLTGRLKDEAEERDWCSEYDDFIDNTSINFFDAQPLHRDREMRVHLTVTLPTNFNLERAIDDMLRDAGFGHCSDFEWE